MGAAFIPGIERGHRLGRGDNGFGQTVGQRLDQGRAVAGTRLVDGFVDRHTHGDDVIAVHLLAAEPAGERFLGDGLGGARHGDEVHVGAYPYPGICVVNSMSQ